MRGNHLAPSIGHGRELLRHLVRGKELNALIVKASGDYDGAKLAIDDDFFFHEGVFIKCVSPPTQAWRSLSPLDEVAQRMM